MTDAGVESAAARILMCPPRYFSIEYEINPWMSRRQPADPERSALQWQQLRAILESLGARIEIVEPQRGLPDLVFTANAAAVRHGRCVLSRFRPEQRRGEEPIFRDRLRELGFEVLELPTGMFFEGAGDALFCGSTLYAGYRIRSSVAAMQEVARLLGCAVTPLELVEKRFYHLDTCFCPVSPDLVIWYPPAFDEYARRVVEAAPWERIALSAEEAAAFAANAVVVGRHVVTNEGCPRLGEDLAARGFTLIETPLEEFTKAGGSAKCLTLRLDGEEASRVCEFPRSPGSSR